MGLTAKVNADINSRGISSSSTASDDDGKKKAVDIFDIPDSDVIPKKTLSQRMLPLSIEDQTYMAKCMKKYGDDYTKMSRDIKINDMQHTEHKLRKLGARFLLLNTEHRRTEIPDKVQHLVQSST